MSLTLNALRKLQRNGAFPARPHAPVAMSPTLDLNDKVDDFVVPPLTLVTQFAEAETIEAETIEAETIEVETIEVETIEVETIEVETIETQTGESGPTDAESQCIDPIAAESLDTANLARVVERQVDPSVGDSFGYDEPNLDEPEIHESIACELRSSDPGQVELSDDELSYIGIGGDELGDDLVRDDELSDVGIESEPESLDNQDAAAAAVLEPTAIELPMIELPEIEATSSSADQPVRLTESAAPEAESSGGSWAPRPSDFATAQEHGYAPVLSSVDVFDHEDTDESLGSDVMAQPPDLPRREIRRLAPTPFSLTVNEADHESRLEPSVSASNVTSTQPLDDLVTRDLTEHDFAQPLEPAATIPLADWYRGEQEPLQNQRDPSAESPSEDEGTSSLPGDWLGAEAEIEQLESAATTDRANAPETLDDAAPVDPLPVATLFEQEALQRLASPVTEQPFRSLLEELTAKNSYLLPSCLIFCSTRSTPRTAETLAHLAILLGENAEDVLLVDANLAEQTLTRHYQALDLPGVCDAFSGETSALHVIRSTSRPRVYLVPAGDDVTGISRDASQLVPETISASLQIWKQHFHRILIDVGAVDSTLLETLATHAESLALVIPAPCPADTTLSKLVKRLSELPANLLGVVLTDFPATPV